uniref:Guanylate-binding protein/Atlastin C-terminal domain-containing protein n=1 Tax=Podarcis muralis TaxID=64176 RepID=A0A670IN23_PODMU
MRAGIFLLKTCLLCLLFVQNIYFFYEKSAGTVDDVSPVIVQTFERCLTRDTFPWRTKVKWDGHPCSAISVLVILPNSSLSVLLNLVKTYVNAINSGDLPCLENAVLALAEIENAAAVCDAISCYEERMRQRLNLPTGSVNELLAVHAECEREATGIFMSRAFGDELVKKSQEKLEQELKQKKEEFCRKNEQASFDRCFAVLTDLSQELEVELRMGIYSVPGGYQRYLEKRDEIEKKYHLVPEKGIQADKALEEFLKSKQTVANSLLQMDHALTDKEKEIEAQRAQAEAAQLQQTLLEQKQAQLQQMMEDEKRSHDAQLQLLREKMEKEKKLMEEETDRVIEQKLKVNRAEPDADACSL